MIELLAGIVTLTATTVLTIAGIGAAFILVPIYLALGIDLHTAMSTALLLNGISMTLASVTYAREKLILWRVAWPMVVAATILAPIGAYASQYVSRNTLLTLFVLFLIFAASMMLFYRQGGRRTEPSAVNDPRSVPIGVTVGGVAGFLGGLLGVGGGNIVVPALIWLGIPPKQASATTAFIVVFSSFAGFAGRASLDSLDPALLAYTVAGSILGALFGSWLMTRKLQNKHVKVLIGILLYVIAAKLLFDMYA